MSNVNSYSNYLGTKKCCAGPVGIVGPMGIPGLRGIQGFTGYTGATGPIGRSCMGPPGPAGKTFIIDHPIYESKYLIHACLEGPEAGVYYRGKATIENNEFVTIKLPDYVELLASNFTIQITSICNNGNFYWYVYGTKDNILVEPEKSAINIQGDGPYKWY